MWRALSLTRGTLIALWEGCRQAGDFWSHGHPYDWCGMDWVGEGGLCIYVYIHTCLHYTYISVANLPIRPFLSFPNLHNRRLT